MKEYTCPHCRNPIYDEDALLCHFCGESLNRASSGALGRIRGGRRVCGLIALLIAILAAISLLVLQLTWK